MARKFLFSVTRKDCDWQYFRGTGPGGQARNKRSNAVRCIHRASGAVGVATDTRSQAQNRKLAFERMASTKLFRTWIKLKVSGLEDIEKKVEKMLDPENLKIEVRQKGKWIEEE